MGFGVIAVAEKALKMSSLGKSSPPTGAFPSMGKSALNGSTDICELKGSIAKGSSQ